MAYQDPVERAEREFAEFEKLHKEALGLVDGAEPDTGVAGQDETSGEAVETPQAEVKTPATETKPDVKESPKGEFETRYKTLQGKYDAEVPRLIADRARLTEETLTLRQQVSDLQRQLQEKPQSEAKAENVDEALDDLESQYGAEFSEALDKRIARLVEKEMRGRKQQESPNGPSPQARPQQEDFLSRLTGLVANAPELNKDRGFIQWLNNTYDPLDSNQRSLQEILIQAVHANDVNRAARIFGLYRPEAQTPTQEPAQNTQQTSGKVVVPSQENLIVPNNRGTGMQTIAGNAGGDAWTKTRVEAFYKDAERGRYSPEEIVRIEKEIFEAHGKGQLAG